MNQRFLMWGLTSIAFVVTLAISSWHDGLWTSDAVPARGNRPVALSLAEPTALPIRPFAPENAAPTVMTAPAATKSETQAQEQQPTPAPAEIATPSMPIAAAEVDTTEFLAHRDRAAQRGSRAR